MNIKVYGSNVCPGTLRFLSILTENGIMPVFINVTGSIDHLKEFILFRDTHAVYEGVRGSGAIGFPLIETEDGSYTKDVNKVLEQLGIETRISYQ